ncbi:alpha-mannosidase [Lentzea sp. NBRC 105346]|uniref:alpha-mannosidase n=1 Tax=Lentzea sp. NBRC 105346 TaxID=3032205 RepID=UPI0024A41C9F|nr:glycoside hydrolase family 38 C-terminal domain-containing protein [Lentzea sp. NBRC 105346]GLZ34174.1 alpha-mannosidase [Lentzea sp. NBRC 105346]
MHDDRRLVEDRLTRALTTRIQPAIYSASTPFTVEAWRVPDEPIPFAQAVADADFRPFAIGDRWGAPWSTTWFRVRATVPSQWAGKRVEAVFDLGFEDAWPGNQAEALVYLPDGTPVKGVAPRNKHVPISNISDIEFYVEAAANPDILKHDFQPTPFGDKKTAPPDLMYRLDKAELAVLDENVWHLSLDLEVLRDLMLELSLDDPRRHEILRAIERSLDALDPHDVNGTAEEARQELEDVLSRPAHASAHTLSAVGHAHIDSAWLWPLRETVRKASRSFANVTWLATQYPEFVFAASQAQQYDWVKKNQPVIYERIKEAVRNGQWRPVGGMWVESDANLPGGEALARQISHGKRFFKQEFGIDTEEIWLPDSFGYTAAFPQLAKLAGAKWFLTQKLSWNQTNKLPHHTFWWEGIDGTRIFTHFPPVDTYNAEILGKELSHAVRNYAEKGRGTRSLLPFGFGDGGGGPTRDMVERARRLRNLEGSPKVEIEPPHAFFEKAQREYPDAPVWSGELYLELHRATYTTQSRTKAGNRRSEHLLREAELWAATANVNTGFQYPYDELDELWKTVLLHQFHDILPGSSIAWVHQEAEQTYADVASALEKIITTAQQELGGGVFNASPRSRKEVTSIDGQPVFVHAPANGIGSVVDSADPVHVNGTTLDNGLVRVEIDDNGLITSVITDGREVLAGPGNLLQLHPDFPNYWDAWDIDAHYKRKHRNLTEAQRIEVVDHGPLIGSVKITRHTGKSTIVQTIHVKAGSKRIDIETEIDWHESEKILKAAFPLDVHADRSAAEIQFGHVYRPTHTNTSWDAARFEVYAHRWVHVAEPGFGVAVVNDSTYGHDISRDGNTTTIRLSLVRAPHIPDPHADQGLHRFTYSLLPGAEIEDAITEGYALNLPLRATAGSSETKPLATTSHPAVVIESIKLADDRSGDVIVRLYESLGGRATFDLNTSFTPKSSAVCDLLENPVDETALEAIALRPFQILTLRLTR